MLLREGFVRLEENEFHGFFHAFAGLFFFRRLFVLGLHPVSFHGLRLLLFFLGGDPLPWSHDLHVPLPAGKIVVDHTGFDIESKLAGMTESSAMTPVELVSPGSVVRFSPADQAPLSHPLGNTAVG